MVGVEPLLGIVGYFCGDQCILSSVRSKKDLRRQKLGAELPMVAVVLRLVYCPFLRV